VVRHNNGLETLYAHFSQLLAYPGQPVKGGNIIGLAFDGNWEAMSGNIHFDQKLKRTINVDIRYVLWLIEKLGGAKHIVDEMTLVE
jgi:hypothetical protein